MYFGSNNEITLTARTTPLLFVLVRAPLSLASESQCQISQCCHGRFQLPAMPSSSSSSSSSSTATLSVVKAASSSASSNKNSLSGLTAFCLFVGGWILFPGLFILQLHLWSKTVLGRRLRKQYDLTEKDCSDIANKLVSAFQAVLATTTGTIVCSYCYDDVLHRSHPLTLIYAWFGLPYFFYDTISMFYVSTITGIHPKKESIWKKFYRFVLKSPVIVIHHIVLAPVGFTLLLFFREGMEKGDFFMGTVYLMEASTPFVCLRFILSKFKMKSSVWYVANGLMMLVLFPIFRIFSLFYAAYLFGKQQSLSTLEALYGMPFGWKLAFFLAVAPQMYWYFLMWRGLVRMLIPGGGGGSSSSKDATKVQEDERAEQELTKEKDYLHKKKSDEDPTSAGEKDTAAVAPSSSSGDGDSAAELNNGAKEFAH